MIDLSIVSILNSRGLRLRSRSRYASSKCTTTTTHKWHSSRLLACRRLLCGDGPCPVTKMRCNWKIAIVITECTQLQLGRLAEGEYASFKYVNTNTAVNATDFTPARGRKRSHRMLFRALRMAGPRVGARFVGTAYLSATSGVMPFLYL